MILKQFYSIALHAIRPFVGLRSPAYAESSHFPAIPLIEEAL